MSSNDTWQIRGAPRTALTWGGHQGKSHQCKYCGIPFLTGERPGFCCGLNGCRVADIKALPPFPPEYSAFIHDEQISPLSRILNLIFSFAALESTHPFSNHPKGLHFISIQGKIYH
jgi:hypothetical protein